MTIRGTDDELQISYSGPCDRLSEVIRCAIDIHIQYCIKASEQLISRSATPAPCSVESPLMSPNLSGLTSFMRIGSCYIFFSKEHMERFVIAFESNFIILTTLYTGVDIFSLLVLNASLDLTSF